MIRYPIIPEPPSIHNEANNTAVQDELCHSQTVMDLVYIQAETYLKKNTSLQNLFEKAFQEQNAAI